MNAENNPIFQTSALDGQPLHARPPRLTWTLFVAQLWLLAAFVGVALVGIAAKLLAGGPSEAQPAVALALGLFGVALVPVAWRNVARQLDRTERESASGDEVPAPATEERAPTTGPGRILPAKPLLLASHR